MFKIRLVCLIKSACLEYYTETHLTLVLHNSRWICQIIGHLSLVKFVLFCIMVTKQKYHFFTGRFRRSLTGSTISRWFLSTNWYYFFRSRVWFHPAWSIHTRRKIPRLDRECCLAKWFNLKYRYLHKFNSQIVIN